MMISSWKRSTRKVWLVAGAAMLLLSLFIGLGAKSVFAGSVDIRDDANVLNNDDKNELRNRVSSLPYNVRIITTNSVNSSNFQTQVQNEVKSLGKGLVLMVSPGQRLTGVAGSGIGITPTEETDIRTSANSSFASANWRGGLDAMIDRSRSLANVSSTPVSSSRSSNGGGFPFIGCLIIGVVALVALSIFGFGRRRQVNNNYAQPGYGQPGYGPGYGQPGYGQPGYGGGGGGMGALGGGAIGAGLGGLVGYELGKNAGRNEGGYGGGGNYANPGNAPDDSASVGGWDTGGGGSSGGWGNDSGGGSGSSGSFDAGGGGDWGGGGGDSGGGGGDSGSW